MEQIELFIFVHVKSVLYNLHRLHR